MALLFNTIVWLVYSYFSWVSLHLPTERIDSLCLEIQIGGDMDFFSVLLTLSETSSSQPHIKILFRFR